MTTSKPWDDQPDFVEGEFCGIKYEIKRHLEMGDLCGYIIIPPGNPFNETNDYDDPMFSKVDVHGGWTYYDTQDANVIIGFDCAHSGDLVPMMEMIQDEVMKELAVASDDTYKTVEFVEDQCKRACWVIAGNTFNSDLNEALYQRYADGE